MNFFNEPDGGFSFTWMNDGIQGPVFVLTANPQLVPLFYLNIGEIMQRLSIQLLNGFA